MDEKKKLAEIKKLHSLKQKPISIKYIKRKYTHDENTNEIFYSRLHQLPDDFLREYLYKFIFTESIRVIDTIQDHYDPITNKRIKWWINKGHGWNCLGNKQARKIIQAYIKPATNEDRFYEIDRFNEWISLYDQQIRTFSYHMILTVYSAHNTSDIRIAQQTGSIYY